jgi:hypothetical protein
MLAGKNVEILENRAILENIVKSKFLPLTFFYNQKCSAKKIIHSIGDYTVKSLIIVTKC